MEYKIGDKVRVINYGHLIWDNIKSSDYFPHTKRVVYEENDDIVIHDVAYELVGQTGIIEVVKYNSQNKPIYSISGIKGKSSWYYNEQLELIENGKKIK